MGGYGEGFKPWLIRSIRQQDYRPYNSCGNGAAILAIPDYSVVKACGHTVLCIGGAISVDRSYRIRAWRQIQEKKHRYGRVTGEQDTLSPNYYWENEAPQYERELLEKIIAKNNIDTVVTHTAPSFCELQSKNEGAVWVAEASKLLQDIQEERSTIDEIYNCLKAHSVTHWFYGHFHQSWLSTIKGISFKMLNIMELHEIRSPLTKSSAICSHIAEATSIVSIRSF